MIPQEPGPEYDRLRHEIEHTRTELGETMEALAAKADVKSRAHQMADDAKARVRETARQAATKAGASAHDAATKAGWTARGVAAKAGATGSSATGMSQAMMRRPMAWVLAALAGIGIVAVARRRRR